jgi:hypothetical protein
MAICLPSELGEGGECGKYTFGPVTSEDSMSRLDQVTLN